MGITTLSDLEKEKGGLVTENNNDNINIMNNNVNIKSNDGKYHELREDDKVDKSRANNYSGQNATIQDLGEPNGDGSNVYIGIDGIYHYYDERTTSTIAKLLARFGFVIEVKRKHLVNLLKTISFWVFFASFAMLIAEFVIGKGFASPRENKMIGPHPEAVFLVGGLVPYYVKVHHQIYRIVLPLIIHFGIIHLLINSVFLIRFCVITEQRWKWRWTLLVFLLTDIGASLLAMNAPKGYNVLTSGASGSICGFIGAVMCETFFAREEMSKVSRYYTLGSLIFSMAVCLILSSLPGYSLGGHLGGFISGVLLGGAIFIRNPAKKKIRIAMILLAVGYFSITILLFLALPARGDESTYYRS
ncbi:hypothetical protein DFA_03289 [Cavenderia fasciculata]|uniref:rhomboid protease n=1 Tax=Cavenderia fasciculata TaxID=261658 RepID=F4PH59_CACFS|nr:uncharacterized protein DFA_03289 [Cavenderia fasciculata]EGG25043.1 hypothetical protein DFA_03289 [Cavenderia fasciculata]|eukprot:XP_004362894.1 hypothetical protein DFA_03289 [Cavenderia fasciculata]